MRQLPQGTVTLLFTDIEGSTRLLQELGRERYVEALTIHRKLLREAFSSHGGVEVEMQGDSFHFSFAAASDAVAAAAAGQRALASYEWPDAPIRVRIGLHTGEPVVADDLYAGLDVHCAARVMSAAHGGQVVLTRPTAALAANGFSLRDLGEHRLKDITDPIWLYQLGDADFPPLRSLNNSNLPSPTSPLIGREREVEELTTRLRGASRLVTLTGPGGTGKTRLALEVAADLVPSFANGVFFVDLAPLRDPNAVPSAVARALGLREEPEEPLERTLESHLRDLELLLVLDNFEHVLAAAPFVARLLASGQGVCALTTTREPLRVGGETEWPLETLAPGDAAALFAERATAVRPDFSLDDVRASVDAICAALDNLPLAIELAAARVRLLAPATLLNRLEARLPLLTDGRRDVPERQRTLRATIEWSYDLLNAEERRCFAALGAFAGGWTLEAAEAVAEAEFDTLSSLVEKSLVRLDGERFGMLETIREFAADQVQLLGMTSDVVRRHADYFARLVEEAEPALRGASQPQALERLDDDLDNILVALQRGIEHRLDAARRIGAYLVYYWYARGFARQALDSLERVASIEGDAGPILRARLSDARALFSSLAGEHARALHLSSEGLMLAREAGDSATLGNSLVIRQMVTAGADDQEACAAAAREAAAFARMQGDRLTLAASLSNLAEFEFARGRADEAEQLATESLELFRSLDDPFNAAGVLKNLAAIAVGRGDLQKARGLLAEAAGAARRSKSQERYVWVLDGFADLALDFGDAILAARLSGAADALATEHQIPRFPFDQSRRERRIADAVERLGRADFDHAYAEGAALPVGEALEIAVAAEPAAR